MPGFKFKWWKTNRNWPLALVASLLAPSALAVITELKLKDDQLQRAFAPRKLALLVGIKEFQDAAFQPLVYPTKDAADLKAFLRDPDTGTSFDHIELLTDRQATADGIIKALDRLQARNTSPEDTVVVYCYLITDNYFETPSRITPWYAQRGWPVDIVEESREEPHPR